MKAYIVACTIFFAFFAFMHGLELAQGGVWRLHEPDFVITSLVTIAILGWSILLLVRPRAK
jgi:hypothetical protein